MSTRDLKVYLTVKGQGQPLVLLHGWGFDHTIWQALAARILSHYTLYLVDLPGFGQTEFMSWEAFKWLLLEQLPRRFAIAGWSMGGLFATRLALEASNRVTHVLNIASSPCFVKAVNWPGIDDGVLEAFSTRLEINPQKTLKDFLALQVPDQAMTRDDHGLQPSILSLRSGLEILRQWDFREVLLDLKMPVGYWFGRLDAIMPYQTYQAMRLLYPAFHYEGFCQSAHVPFLSEPDQFIRTLTEFLQ